jgi:ligand-binding sensor domain-containing protein/signal transduction histidine kinase/CheY-like chemotaxis protein/AraC-like DNA-binding protein
MRSAILFGVFLSGLTAFGQIPNYNIYNISIDHGLTTNELQYVYQDSYGYLWVATYEGVFRWDGYAFKKYNHNDKDPRSIDHNIVYSIFEDSGRRLWIGTIEGLNLYDRAYDRFIKHQVGQQGQKIPVNAIREDSKKQLWLGTSLGLCKYNYADKKSEWFADGTTNTIFCLAVDSEDNIWAGTFNNGVKKFFPATRTFQQIGNQDGTISRNIKSIFCDEGDNIWVGTTDKGLTVVDRKGKLVRHYDNFSTSKGGIQNTINCIYKDKNGIVWIGVSRSPLYYLAPGSPEPVPLTRTVLGASDNQLTSVSWVHEDTFANVWFSTTGNGLFYTNAAKNVFENYLHNPSEVKSLRTGVITCFYEDEAGHIWIGTEDSGFIRANIEDNAFSVFNTSTHKLSNDAITDIKGDKSGKLWMTTWNGGVMVFDPENESVKKFIHDPLDPRTVPINDAKVLLPDDTLIWIGTHGEGLAAYDLKRGIFIHSRNNDLLPVDLSAPGWINHLYKDSRKRLWISTYSGLFMFDGKQIVQYQNSADTTSVSSNSVNMVTEDIRGRIWIASEGGLDQFDELHHHFLRFQEKLGLPQIVKSIVADRTNKLWIGTNEGIASVQTEHFAVNRYTGSDGLQGNSFFQKAVLRDREGRLYFGGHKGFNVFHPENLTVNSSAPDHFYFTSLYIYNELQSPQAPGSPLSQVLAFTDNVVLSPGQSFFSVEVTAVNLNATPKTKYICKLEGVHDQWVNLGNERKISFTNLDPGTYHLKFKYTHDDIEWHDAGKSLAITILPPWYKSWWFRLTIVLSISACVIGIFYLRIASIKRRNRLLKAEVKNRTHELSEANAFLTERNEEILLQKERLEEFNGEILRQSKKIIEQQQHISEQNRQLEITVTELQKLNNTKDHFFSILAHDLKNPVSALTGISDYMKTNFLKLEKKEALGYLDSIHKSSNAIYDLLINLLNWSRAQSKNIEYCPVIVNIAELVGKNISLLEPQFTNKHISLEVNVNPAHVGFADYNMIDTVIRNIVTNSIKFTHYNGKVVISTKETAAGMELLISDNGVGMSAEQVGRLFSPDKRNIASGTAGEKGTGLGLVITHEFLQINKGHIRVESEPEKGTDFYITLPLPDRHAARPSSIGHPIAPDKLQPEFWETYSVDKLLKLKGKKILIVDDNTELRTYLKLILSATFEIFEASDGEEGLRSALEVQPIAIVTDLMMPRMNGLEFCREIRRNTSTSHIPVIVLTSQWEEQSQVEGYEAGADIYLTKPVKKELLLQIIINLIDKQEKVRRKIHESILDHSDFQKGDIGISKLDELFLQRVVGFIEKHISDTHIDSNAICDEIGVSRTVLYSKIRSLTGQTVHELLKTIRLKKSIKLLLDGTMSISQIALEVGFNSHSYYDKCFVKQYGIGPKDYVAKHRTMKIGHK